MSTAWKVFRWRRKGRDELVFDPMISLYTDRQTDKQTDGRTDRQADRQTGRQAVLQQVLDWEFDGLQFQTHKK